MLPTNLLRRAEKPGRYTGGEWNSRCRPGPNKLAVILAFPDVYEIGISNLGLQILYSIINERPDAFADRAYLPWADMAGLMRGAGIPAGGLETGLPLAEADIIGISLQHEMNATGVLELLDLAGLPLRSADRTSGPLILAGGPGCLNPEPMSAFFDAILIGDGEEAISELVDAAVAARLGNELNREATLAAWGEIEGMYLPERLKEGYRVKRRIVRDLDTAPFPTRQLVPGVEAVHDRAVIEIMRGCRRGCRFCQAGYAYRPVRERGAETVCRLASESLAATGHEELSLTSLSSSDHTAIAPMLQRLQAEHGETSFSLPSLRVGGFGIELAEAVSSTRRSGLTFAPEAGSERLRRIINKNVSEDELMEVAGLAFGAGWKRLKLYFMFGLPGETEEDVLEIGRLADRMLNAGAAALPKPGGAGSLSLTLSISNFVPKPHTPFQWAEFGPPEELRRRFRLLRESIRDRRLTLKWHSLEASTLEAALARGGREIGPVIETAWRMGARLDNWSDLFDMGLWRRAFQENGLDLEEAAGRHLVPGQPLPWSHIECGPSQDYLLAELERSETGQPSPDCRPGCRSCGTCDDEVRMITG